MEDDLNRCRQAMNAAMKEAQLNPNAWAKLAGVSESGVRGFLSGSAPNISVGYLERLARVLGKRASDFLKIMVPVVGYVGAGQELHFIDDLSKGAGLEEVEPPIGIDETVVAVIVRGDSMLPSIKDGWILFYHRNGDGVTEDCINKLCVVRLANSDQTYVKEVYRAPERGRFNLYSSTGPFMENVELEWAARVLDIRPR
jgi:transcriptional regulator with XRE-family HTH domain